MNLTSNEVIAVANIIGPIFDSHLSSYSFKKYPAEDYARYKSVFSQKGVENNEIYAALVWKWGHVGKKKFPQKQLELIHKIENLWPEYVQSKDCTDAKSTFQWWRSKLPKTAYISQAYLTHLIHHADPLPIIDQHNFRAMNSLIKAVRPTHEATTVPRTWKDITDLQAFMSAVLSHLPERSFGELDRFLMRYGWSIKPR
ncbi:MAG TPA: hypothetical protein VJ654_17890 [Noviherbaspirillum sp.]|nr:hypothetical protein [Noviherbaspirillum sp.]